MGNLCAMAGSIADILHRMGLKDTASDVEVGDGSRDEKENKTPNESIETHALAI